MNHFLPCLAFIVSLFPFESQKLFGQQLTHERKVFSSIGLSAYSDYIIGPSVFVVVKDNFNINNNSSIKLSNASFSVISITYQLRYNIAEFGNNASLSLSAPISIGASQLMGDEKGNGFGSFNMPLFFEFNYGNGSTYSTENEKGIILGAGLEFTKSPIIGGVKNTGADSILVVAPTNWFQPVLEVGYRFWGVSNTWELNFKYGFGNATPIPKEYLIKKDDLFFSSKTFKLTLLMLLNY